MSYLLQHLLSASAEKFPKNNAVIFGEESLSYRELETDTNKVAHYLISIGVKRGDRVGIYINKSIPSIVSIYGILKVGAVYVPLDPQSPPSRVSYIINNCNIKVVLTSSAKANTLIKLSGDAPYLSSILITDTKLIDFDETTLQVTPWSTIEKSKEVDLPKTNAIQNDLAYIIYTSGSTGNPKGVMISHLNSLTFVNWAFNTMGFTSKDVFSSHAPLHFDLSIFDIYVAAKSGAALVLVPETMSMFPPRLAQWIEKNKITVWYSVPSILSMMVTHGQLDKRDFSNLRMVVYAGEVFPVKYLRKLMAVVPDPEYYNLYGPTETNVITYYKTPQIPDNQTVPVPIGKQCENMEVFAVTKEGTIVTKPGEEGELMARGTCVAQGYWGDEEKTNKVFVKNPFELHFEDRMYKTGDLVTLDENGDYIFKGRIDHMIKSRGYRIEIGEIEAAIYGNEMIKEAAVIAIPDDLITNRIKAIVVLKEGVVMDAAGLRVYCAEKIPKYMVPESVEFRENLPKTSTGKVNKPQLLKESLTE